MNVCFVNDYVCAFRDDIMCAIFIVVIYVLIYKRVQFREILISTITYGL